MDGDLAEDSLSGGRFLFAVAATFGPQADFAAGIAAPEAIETVFARMFFEKVFWGTVGIQTLINIAFTAWITSAVFIRFAGFIFIFWIFVLAHLRLRIHEIKMPKNEVNSSRFFLRSSFRRRQSYQY